MTDGTATIRGRVVREHLQPHNPLIGPLRPVVRRLETTTDRHRPLELLVAGIGLVTVLLAARNAATGRPEHAQKPFHEQTLSAH